MRIILAENPYFWTFGQASFYHGEFLLTDAQILTGCLKMFNKLSSQPKSEFVLFWVQKVPIWDFRHL